MTPTQIADLEAEFLRRSRQEREDQFFLVASVWELAAALLIEAAGKKPTRRKFKPLDLNRIQG